MGRPSLAIERRRQILDGITRCVAVHGIADSSLERMAAESGFSRSHIRHYLGNRDDVILALWDHLMSPYSEQVALIATDPDPAARLNALIDFMFGPQWERLDSDAALDALFSAGATHPELQRRINQTYLSLEQQIAGIVRATDPSMPQRAADEVAYSLLCLAIGASAFSALPFPRSHRVAAHAMAHQMVAFSKSPSI